MAPWSPGPTRYWVSATKEERVMPVEPQTEGAAYKSREDREQERWRATAEALRLAAMLMRERAEAVLAKLDNPKVVYDHFPGCNPWFGDADHIRSWHPAVAIAVADWLDRTAEDGDNGYDETDDNYRHALTVARVYLHGLTAREIGLP